MGSSGILRTISLGCRVKGLSDAFHPKVAFEILLEKLQRQKLGNFFAAFGST